MKQFKIIHKPKTQLDKKELPPSLRSVRDVVSRLQYVNSRLELKQKPMPDTVIAELRSLISNKLVFIVYQSQTTLMGFAETTESLHRNNRIR